MTQSIWVGDEARFSGETADPATFNKNLPGWTWNTNVQISTPPVPTPPRAAIRMGFPETILPIAVRMEEN